VNDQDRTVGLTYTSKRMPMAGPTGAIISVIDQDFFHGLQISAPPGWNRVRDNDQIDLAPFYQDSILASAAA
jgi:hypothetical protein